MTKTYNKRLFTSESVTEGHPDKLCDQVADAVLDAALTDDPDARVACEVCTTTGVVIVLGEITTSARLDIPKIVRGVVKDIGYNSSEIGFDYKSCSVLVALNEQSKDIAQGVDSALEYSGDIADKIGAGDQGMMFGCASDETPELMPLPIMLAHKLTRRLTEVRKSGILKYLRPDGKAQVTVEYAGDKPKRVEAVVVSSQHSEDVDYDKLKSDILKHVIKAVIPKKLLDENTKYYINPTGRFVIGGPAGDSGVTGRKIIVDTYGGYCAHGGGAMSGKDPTKVDRSGLYMARYICKNLVAAKAARRCELEVAYAIGCAHPVSLTIDTFGTGAVSDERLIEIINKVFDLRPYSIIKNLELKKPVFRATANYGHFGREEFSWERTDKAAEIAALLEDATR
ncbi:MAG: methionine adenosyltransferase [Clostridiaceae bacterium]|jgi:S-adenosylmethionine synthetase|nr:methionine adenosyltransferase [Clostridiaceae bacterium]